MKKKGNPFLSSSRSFGRQETTLAHVNCEGAGRAGLVFCIPPGKVHSGWCIESVDAACSRYSCAKLKTERRATEREREEEDSYKP